MEAPLEISLAYGPLTARAQRAISVTMRTPGQDFELALGFLFTEGIIHSPDQVEGVRYLDRFLPEAERSRVLVDLHPEVAVDFDRLERHFYTSSSCGVCGKSSIEAVRVSAPVSRLPAGARIDLDLIHELPARLRERQRAFDCTGGLHASALFDTTGVLSILREDVGRHNALDKLIGAAFLQEQLPLTDRIVLLSGRISFELAQKALLAGAPIVLAIGAPSSLAVELAEESGLTLVGFVREGRCNIYTHPERLI